MSTIGNLSSSSRRRSNVSSISNVSSNYSKESTGGTPSPRSPRIITSRPPRISPSISDEDTELPKRKTTWLEKVDEIRSLWNYWIATLRSPSVTRLVRNGLLISGFFLIAVSLISWDRIEWNKINIMLRTSYFKETPAWETLVGRNKEKKGIMPESKHFELDNDDLRRDPMYEMVLPLNALTKLNIGPELDALQGAYADTGYTIINLTSSIPALSVDAPDLSTTLRRFRNFTWNFSEAIGDYGGSLEIILNELQQESKDLGIALSKIQPEYTWQNHSDSEQGRKIAAVWITHYEWLKREIDNIWEDTLKFQDEIKDAINQRINLEKEFDIAQPRMTKEAKKRDLENFDFPAAYKLLRRFNSTNSPASGDKTIDGYERRLEDIILSTSSALELANGEIKNVLEKLQRSQIQKSTMESQNETDENGNETNNASSLALFEIPKLEQQIEALTATYESYVQVKIYLNDMKHDLEQRLKGKAHASKERIQVYDYVLSGQQDDDYMKRQSDKVKEINEKNEERKRLKEQRRMEQEGKDKNWKPWHW
ncbi:hypothetical protein OCU04_011248 [Sclerotinia nivalis]|uniref:Uncharacterized protein n=1 Tax=Sclerotinia nivalis TaxID=352851 RepID=A0A9X0AEW1_9HELO|nr:hypothetical protein OCU04_011248 [Sclerotinia nivalis]